MPSRLVCRTVIRIHRHQPQAQMSLYRQIKIFMKAQHRASLCEHLDWPYKCQWEVTHALMQYRAVSNASYGRLNSSAYSQLQWNLEVTEHSAQQYWKKIARFHINGDVERIAKNYCERVMRKGQRSLYGDCSSVSKRLKPAKTISQTRYHCLRMFNDLLSAWSWETGGTGITVNRSSTAAWTITYRMVAMVASIH